jgi:hypothetical protein
MMMILTAAALAAAQPAPTPQAPAGPSAGHAMHGQMQQGQMQHVRDCPCCEHEGANAEGDCCDHMQQRNQPNRQ